MKQLFLFGACALLIVSCKKAQNDPVPSGTSFVIPSSEGSYWIYQWSKIDSLGNETPLNIVDTVRITGHVTQNGYSWIEYTGTSMGAQPTTWLQRDSSGYIVKSNGRVQYSYVSTAPFHTTSDAFYDEVYQMGPDAVISSAFGILDVLDRHYVITRAAGSTLPMAEGVNACGDESYTFHTYFASGIGEVRQECAIYSPFIHHCETLRRELVSYHIE